MRRRWLDRGRGRGSLFVLMDTAVFLLARLSAIVGESAQSDGTTPLPLSSPAPFDMHSCVAHSDGIYADPFDCHRYYHCVRQKTFYFRCFDGFVFDPCRRRCIFQTTCMSLADPCPGASSPGIAPVTEAAKGTEIAKNSVEADQTLDLEVNDKNGEGQSRNVSRLIMDRLGKNASAAGEHAADAEEPAAGTHAATKSHGAAGSEEGTTPEPEAGTHATKGHGAATEEGTSPESEGTHAATKSHRKATEESVEATTPEGTGGTHAATKAHANETESAESEATSPPPSHTKKPKGESEETEATTPASGSKQPKNESTHGDIHKAKGESDEGTTAAPEEGTTAHGKGHKATSPKHHGTPSPEGEGGEGALAEGGQEATANATEPTVHGEGGNDTVSKHSPTPKVHENATTKGEGGAGSIGGGYGIPTATEEPSEHGGRGEAESGTTVAHHGQTYLVRVIFNRRIVSSSTNSSNGEEKEPNVDVTPKPWNDTTTRKTHGHKNASGEAAESEPTAAPDSELVPSNETEGNPKHGKSTKPPKGGHKANASVETDVEEEKSSNHTENAEEGEKGGKTPKGKVGSKENAKNASAEEAEKAGTEPPAEHEATKPPKRKTTTKRPKEEDAETESPQGEEPGTKAPKGKGKKSGEASKEKGKGKPETAASMETPSANATKSKEEGNSSQAESEEKLEPHKNKTEALAVKVKEESAGNKCAKSGAGKNASGEAGEESAPGFKDQKRLLQSLKSEAAPPLNFRFVAGQEIVAKLGDLLGEINITNICRTPPVAPECKCPGTEPPEILNDAESNGTLSELTGQSLRRHCSSLTCFNGAMYIELSNGECGCLCPAGWKGDRCQHLIDHSTCHCANGGRCVSVGNGTYACRCPLGYLGGQCQYPYPITSSTYENGKFHLCDLETAAENKCENGGICLRDSTKKHKSQCYCPPGFAGDQCENKL